MVVVRLARGGSHNRPYFHIVAADSRARLTGRFLEKLGFHNPLVSSDVESFRINTERLNYWISVGAQVSPAVKKLLKNKGNPVVEAKAEAQTEPAAEVAAHDTQTQAPVVAEATMDTETAAETAKVEA